MLANPIDLLRPSENSKNQPPLFQRDRFIRASVVSRPDSIAAKQMRERLLLIVSEFNLPSEEGIVLILSVCAQSPSFFV